jgi:hypothetical protein
VQRSRDLAPQHFRRWDVGHGQPPPPRVELALAGAPRPWPHDVAKLVQRDEVAEAGANGRAADDALPAPRLGMPSGADPPSPLAEADLPPQLVQWSWRRFSLLTRWMLEGLTLRMVLPALTLT